MYQVGYDPLNSAAFRTAGQSFESAANGEGGAPSPVLPANDCVRAGLGQWFCPPREGGQQSGTGGIIAGFNSFIDNLFSWVSNAMNSLSGSLASPAAGPEQTFTNAALTSWGDPHLGISGTTSDGQSVGSNWDSMAAHGNLLSSDSFNGGFQVSNQVTAPSASGVTLNSNVSVTTNGGLTRVSLDKNGTATLLDNGRATTLQAGQQYVLGNGEVVTDNRDGSLNISESNGQGGSIATTLETNGAGGVNFSANASNVDLGGYLVTKSDDPGIVDFGLGSSEQPPLYQTGPYQLPPFQSQPYQYQPRGYQPADYFGDATDV